MIQFVFMFASFHVISTIYAGLVFIASEKALAYLMAVDKNILGQILIYSKNIFLFQMVTQCPTW